MHTYLTVQKENDLSKSLEGFDKQFSVPLTAFLGYHTIIMFYIRLLNPIFMDLMHDYLSNGIHHFYYS